MTCHVEREAGSSAQHIGAIKAMWFSCDYEGCTMVAEDKDIPIGGLGLLNWECAGGRHFCPEHRLTPSVGVQAITAERRRQIEIEGWTPEHDAKYVDDELARAAACYALGKRPPGMWPWEDKWWKPEDATRNLEKAGALIAAEIDRLTAGGKNADIGDNDNRRQRRQRPVAAVCRADRAAH